MTVEPAESYDADELGQYRSLSVLAVLSFLLGISSAAAFVSPLLIVLPLAAVALSMLALKSIAASGGGLSGESLARWGIALAIFFGVAAYSRGMIRDSLLEQQADEVAREWLTLVAREDGYGVLDLMTNGAIEKFVPAVVRTESIPFFARAMGRAQMRQDPLVSMLREFQSQGDVSLDLIESEFGASYSSLQAALKYQIGSLSGDPRSLLLVLKRADVTPEQSIWLIDSWSPLD